MDNIACYMGRVPCKIPEKHATLLQMKSSTCVKPDNAKQVYSLF